MDYKLLSEQMKYNEKIYAQTTEHAMQSDVIVPDFLPDMKKIVFVNSSALLKQKICGADHASVEGELCCDILYMPEQTPSLRCLKTTIPFNHSFTNTRTDENSMAVAKVNVLHCEVRLINSRKINIKAIILIEISCFKNLILNISSDFDGNNLPVQTNKKEMTMYLIDSVSDKNFVLEEELKIPQMRYPIENLLYTNSKINTNDIKTVNGKVVVKASAVINVLYTVNSDTGQTEMAEYEIPFSQIMDIPQSSNEGTTDILFNIKNIDITPREDNEGIARIMDARIGIEMNAISSSNHSFETLNDAFGLEEKIVLDKKDITSDKLICDTKGQATLKDSVSFETGAQVDKIISVNCSGIMDNVEIYDAKVNVNGMVHADILCKNNANNDYMNLKRQLKLNYKQPLSSNDENIKAVADISVSSVSYNLNMAGEIELRIICEVHIKEFANENQQIVTAAKPGEKLKDVNSSDIVIYYPQKGDTLWSVAKKYSIKMADIAKVNSISDNNINPNSIIIIPSQKR
ncbi:hypothetical protein SDC9_85278 [bioreactor metagenome]|uniref:LysM domain-containing protein n=1 Tax=bioreactor metagenome TaxID=1076179 RepID=A0A644ZEC6_9ZZZZ